MDFIPSRTEVCQCHFFSYSTQIDRPINLDYIMNRERERERERQTDYCILFFCLVSSTQAH